MPFFSGKFSNKQIVINVLVGLPYDDSKPPSPFPFMENPSYKALIDTGATNTCISPKIIEDLSLIPEGKRPVLTATHETSANLFHVSFYIPIAAQIGKDLRFDAHETSNVEVTEIMQPNNFDVLLGMDILASCSLFIAQNNFTLGY